MNFAALSRLKVGLDFAGDTIPVGRLGLQDRQLLFEYDADFLARGLDLSPFRLPLRSGAQRGDPVVFEGLPGLFNDSLPDGWGRLLLDRQARRQGVDPNALSALDRLACVGRGGMGALVYEPDRAEHDPPSPLDLDALAHETVAVLEGEADAVLTQLLALNASSQGARPKIMVGVNIDRTVIRSGEEGGGFDPLLIKFAARSDEPDIGRVEYAYSLMARAAGLDMPETHLFETPAGAYFGARRFDRDGKDRLHMHSLSGLLHADHRVPSLDYDMLMRVTAGLTRDTQQVEKAFALACFNVLARNRDDHGKNFAFLMGANGLWRLAPAYDLTFSAGPQGEHSTTIMGEGRNPTAVHLRQLGHKAGLKPVVVETVLDGVTAAVARWPEFADAAGLGRGSARLIASQIGV